MTLCPREEVESVIKMMAAMGAPLTDSRDALTLPELAQFSSRLAVKFSGSQEQDEALKRFI